MVWWVCNKPMIGICMRREGKDINREKSGSINATHFPQFNENYMFKMHKKPEENYL